MRRSTLAVCMLIIPFILFAGGGSEEAPVASTSTPPQTVIAGENWGFSWEFAAEEIEFTVMAPTTGWVAIGFNPSRMMKDAHYILGYVADGQLFLRDDYGTGLTSHASDDTVGGAQHVRPLGHSEEGGVTTITFALPLQAQDAYDLDFVPGKAYKVLLAYGANGADNFTGMHRKRASFDTVLD
ncbi:MAG: DOMON domain-containing protein [Sphaerochaetaceae bacterium]